MLPYIKGAASLKAEQLGNKKGSKARKVKDYI